MYSLFPYTIAFPIFYPIYGTPTLHTFTHIGIIFNLVVIAVVLGRRQRTTAIFKSGRLHESIFSLSLIGLRLKVIYKGCFKSFVALYADRICSDQHFVENRIEKFLFV